MKSLLLALLIILTFHGASYAATFVCLASSKIDKDGSWDKEFVENDKHKVIIEESQKGAFLSACYFSTTKNKMTCDDHVVDKVVHLEEDQETKFYSFSRLIDVQIFSDLNFVHNNGWGEIYFGQCRLAYP